MEEYNQPKSDSESNKIQNQQNSTNQSVVALKLNEQNDSSLNENQNRE